MLFCSLPADGATMIVPGSHKSNLVRAALCIMHLSAVPCVCATGALRDASVLSMCSLVTVHTSDNDRHTPQPLVAHLRTRSCERTVLESCVPRLLRCTSPQAMHCCSSTACCTGLRDASTRASEGYSLHDVSFAPNISDSFAPNISDIAL